MSDDGHLGLRLASAVLHAQDGRAVGFGDRQPLFDRHDGRIAGNDLHVAGDLANELIVLDALDDQPLSGLWSAERELLRKDEEVFGAG